MRLWCAGAGAVLKRARQMVLWSIGLSLLALLFYQVGPGAVWAYIHVMGWGYVPVLLIALAWNVSNTWAWAVCFDPAQPRPGFWTLFYTKLAGEAVGNVTPASHVGGEVAKAYMLRDRISVTRGVPSLVVNKTIEMISGLVFALAGAALVLWQFSLPREVQIGLGAALLVGAVGIGAAVVSQRQRAFVGVLNVFKRLGLTFLEPRRAKFEEIDQAIADFYIQNKKGFWMCMALRLVSWILGTAEVYVILYWLDQPVSFASAFLLTSLSLIINTAFFFIPSGVGIFEGGHVFLFHLLGWGADLGLGVGLVRRIRKIFWIALGFALIAMKRHKVGGGRQNGSEDEHGCT